MAEMMIGGSLKDISDSGGARRDERFAVAGLILAAGHFDIPLKDSVLGAGRRDLRDRRGGGERPEQLMLAISANAGGGRAIRMDGKAIGGSGSTKAQRGLAAVPEERNGHAAVPEFSLPTTPS